MPGDYTRFTFKPRKNYAALLRQQGRVGLDSDFNEMSELADRRWRAETMDVIGRAAVSDFTAPDAFKVTNPNPAAPGSFDIGVGRMYVDGLLAENHGRPPEQYDAALGEMRGTLPVPYTNQPYLPAPLPPVLVPPPAVDRTDLVYLDVWQRELGFIEDPEIREIALGGPDTATRLQTVWQVRVLKGVGDKQCGSDIPAWNSLIAPSTGRLTTSTVAPPPSGDPCVITPEGGYRGLENRLYRVEVHTGGGLGTAKFKWSRDNASVASAVIGIEAGPPGKTKLRLRSLGRDRVLRFHKNDWIEVLDDFTEFRGHPPGESGFMARIDDIDEADQALILDRTVTAGLFDAINPGARHTRVRRWDQKASVDANGLLTVVAGPIDLGDDSGIRITFGGQLRVGDHWVFAARTANGTVEVLTQAPPRGVLHHYARLAMIHWAPGGGTTTVEDCRPHWPPRGCCLTVRPGESIQAAIDSLPPEGGCVCLKVGTHTITQPIRIAKSNVTLHGETVGARVVRANGADMLAAGYAAGRIDDVTVAHLRFEVTGGDAADLAMIAAGAVDHFTLEGCELVMAAAPGLPGMPLIPTIGVFLEAVEGAAIAGNRLERLVIGVWGLGSPRLEVSRNHLRGPFLEDPPGVLLAMGEYGVLIQVFSPGPHRIEHNRIEGYAAGVFLASAIAGGAKHHLILGNEIARTGLADSGAPPRFAIEVKADHCTVAGNAINLPSGLCGGIWMRGLHAVVADNHVDSTASQNDPKLPVGIQLGTNLPGAPAEHGVIRGNRLTGRQNAIWVEQAGHVEVADNHIEDIEGQLEHAVLLVHVESARVEGNYVYGSRGGIFAFEGSDNRLAGNVLRAGGTGLGAYGERSLDVEHNRVESMSHWGFAGLGLVNTVSLSHNHFISCSYDGVDGSGSAAVGIVLIVAPGKVRIESCEVLDTGIPENGGSFQRPAYGILGLWLHDCLVHGNLVSYTHTPTQPPMKDLEQEDRALVLHGVSRIIKYQIPVSPFFEREIPLDSCAQVVDNSFVGPGLNALIDFLEIPNWRGDFDSFERVIFNNNHCLHYVFQHPGPDRATVQIRRAAAIVMGNQMQAFDDDWWSVNFHNSKQRDIYMGNITTFEAKNVIEVPRFGALPVDQTHFNLNK